MGKPENKIEKYLKEQSEKNGFMCLKLLPSKRGLPDRILIGYGQTIYVETKREDNGRLSKIQEIRIQQMKNHGVPVYVCDTKELIDTLLLKYKAKR